MHSTETALLKVQSDITDALDKGSLVVLIMLDLSAAFDTIVNRIRDMFEIKGSALDWISYNLSVWNQSVQPREQGGWISGYPKAPS